MDDTAAALVDHTADAGSELEQQARGAAGRSYVAANGQGGIRASADPASAIRCMKKDVSERGFGVFHLLTWVIDWSGGTCF